MSLTLNDSDTGKKTLKAINNLLNSAGVSSELQQAFANNVDSTSSDNSDSNIKSKISNIMPDSNLVSNLAAIKTSSTNDSSVKKPSSSFIKDAVKAAKATISAVKSAKNDKDNKAVAVATSFINSDLGKDKLGGTVSKLLTDVGTENTAGLITNLTSALSSNKALDAKFKSALAFLNKELCGNPNEGIAGNSNASNAIAGATASAAFSLLACPLDKASVTKMALKMIAGSKATSSIGKDITQVTGGAVKGNVIVKSATSVLLAQKKVDTKTIVKDTGKSLNTKIITSKLASKKNAISSTKTNFTPISKKDQASTDTDTKKAAVDTANTINGKNAIATSSSTNNINNTVTLKDANKLIAKNTIPTSANDIQTISSNAKTYITAGKYKYTKYTSQTTIA